MSTLQTKSSEVHQPRNNSRAKPPPNQSSRLLILIPFFCVFMTLAVGYIMMERYRYAIDRDMMKDSYLWTGFERNNGIILTVFAAAALAGALSILNGMRKTFKSIAAEVQRVSRGGFDIPLDHVSEKEVSQLQDQFTNLVQALNRLIQDTGMGASFTVDMNNNVRLINPLAQLLFLDVGPNKALGQPLEEILSPRGSAENQALIQLLRQSNKSRQPIEEAEVKVALPNGRQLMTRVRTSFIKSDEESRMVVLLVAQDLADITGLKANVERAARFLTLGSLAARLAHEIRNPLASVAGLVEILREETDTNDKYRLEFIAQIEKSCERLNRFLEGLMNISALEKCELVPLSPDTVINEAVAFKSFEAKAAGKSLVVNLDSNLPLIRANSEWLGRAVINVINNAFDETPENGVITISVKHNCSLQRALGNAAYLDINVHNTGSYISPEQRDLVFEPFVTGKSSGTGLGLCIVQQVLHAHGGLVLVESDAETGTQFTLRLPAFN